MNSKPRPVINISREEFGAVLTCAVRYAIGRRTYMPHLVIGFIRSLLPYIDKKTLWTMKQDIAAAGSYGDPVIDEPEWRRFLSEVEEEFKKVRP